MPPAATPDGPAPPGLDLAALVHIRRSLLLTLVAGLLLLVVFATLPPRPLILHVLQKLAHPCVFGVIALALLVLQRQRADALARPVGLEYLLALAAATALGALSEIGQMFTYRDPALHDVWLDARGAVCALAFAASCDLRCRPRGREHLRGVYLTAALLLALVIAAPLAWASAAYANRAWRFPVLFVPESPLDTYFIAITDRPAARTPLETPWSRAPGERTLRVPLLTHPYSGVLLEEPSADWSGFRTLLVDVVNPGRTPLELTVRILDRAHAGRYPERFNARFALPARSRQLLEVPVASARTAPGGWAIDLSQVASVDLFRSGAGGTRELLLNRLELR